MDKTKKSFAVSGALHISIALSIIYFMSNKETPAEKTVTIPVASFQKEQSKPEAPIKEERKEKQKPQHLQQKQPISKPLQTTPKETPHIANKEPQATKQENTAPTQSQQKQKSVDETREYLDANLAKIREAIAKHKRYPASASKMGCEGVCLVSFKLHPVGAVEDIKIAKSSGFTALDRSSIQTIEDAANEMPRPHKSTTITIPIEYKLN